MKNPKMGTGLGLISLFPRNHVRNYYKDNLSFDNVTAAILKKNWPRIDRYLLTRKPKLNLDNGLVYLNSMYMPNEIRIDHKPYSDLALTILPVISELKIKSVVDVGCSNGLLINELYRRNIKVAGYEVFDFLRDAAPVEVKTKIIIQDFRTLFKIDREFDLVVSLEVGEHIDPSKLDLYLQNLVNLSNKYILLSWSHSYPPKNAPPQHLSPLNPSQVKKLLLYKGFKKDLENTRRIRNGSLDYSNFYNHWRTSITLYEKI